MTTFLGVTLEDWAYIATIASVLGAAVAFGLNVRSQIRQRSIESCIRYISYHERLFSEGGYLRTNVAAMEAGTFKRNEADQNMEKAFREMLSEFERLALLHKAGGAPESINAYMLGYFAKHIFPVLTNREKAEPYWELAVDFICETKKAADKFDALSKEKRLKFIMRNHF